MAKGNSVLRGITGEYYAAAKLFSMGLTAAMTVKNSPDFDILVTDGKNQKMIQVKTTEDTADWVFSKMVTDSNPNKIYILVLLKQCEKCDSPAFYIVPEKDIMEQQQKADKKYLERYKERHGEYPPEEGKGVYHFSDKEGKYKDNWKLLKMKINL